jgi:hypothetical protein
LSTVLVIVMVALGEAHTPATEAMMLALRASLGGSPVLVREGAPPDGPALAELAHAEGATMVASIRWTDADRAHAAIRAFITSPGTFVDRELVFGPSDDPRERGRAVGLVLATLVPEPARPPVVAAAAVSPPPAPPEPAPERWTVEAAAIAALGIPGPGGGIGGAVAVRRRLSPHWAARAGGRAWVGEVATAQASSRTLAGGLGLAGLLTPPAARLGLEVRLDLLIIDESLAHFSQDDPAPVRRGRVLPGGDLLAELALRLSGGASLTLAAGAITQAGTTEIFVHGARVAALPAVRVIAEAGLRVRL